MEATSMSAMRNRKHMTFGVITEAHRMSAATILGLVLILVRKNIRIATNNRRRIITIIGIRSQRVLIVTRALTITTPNSIMIHMLHNIRQNRRLTRTANRLI